MKKYIMWIICMLVMLFLYSCGTVQEKDAANTSAASTSTASTTDVSSKDHEIVYEITTSTEYNKLAMDFDELIQDSELIVKICVEDVLAFVGNDGMIQTEITPRVQNVYKGSYNNQKLYVNGGELLYDEFCENEIIKRTISGRENPNGKEELFGKYVRQCVDEQYIFQAGDEYIFFAKKREDSEKCYSLYGYQGTYKIVDSMIENSALDEEEPLKVNLDQIFGAETDLGKITTEETFVERINEGINKKL